MFKEFIKIILYLMKNHRIASFASKLLKARYRVKISGKELLESDRSSLYLPNHPAEVDPMILLSEIAQLDDAVPMVSDVYYNLPIVHSFMKKIGAVPVADFDAGHRDPEVLNKMRKAMISALKDGKSIALYPSGQLAAHGYEKVFNKQSAYKLTQELDDSIRVIGVRQQGLWGSMWSKAWIGKSPSFFTTLLKSVFYILANFIFFVPKRDVEIEFVDITEEAKKYAKEKTRKEFNAYLEDFYNVKGTEYIRYMRHYFYAPKLKRAKPKGIKGKINDSNRIAFYPIEN